MIFRSGLTESLFRRGAYRYGCAPTQGSGKPLVSFVLVGNPISFEKKKMLKPSGISAYGVHVQSHQGGGGHPRLSARAGPYLRRLRCLGSRVRLAGNSQVFDAIVISN